MKCENPTCNKEVDQPDHANQVKIFCSLECRQSDYNRYIWHTNERKRLKAAKREHLSEIYRDDDKCGEEKPLPIEIAFIKYCLRCLPNAPKYDFDEWYDIHLTFGPIDW